MKFKTRFMGLALAVIAFSGIGAGFASAQTSVMLVSPQQTACFNPLYNLRFGAADYLTGGTVSQLQSYLASQGFFSNAYLGSGRFGSVTLRAVAQYQAAHGIPATGYFGPMTRALVQQTSCGAVVTPPTGSAATLYSVNPTSGAVGTSVSITGFGFTSSNTVLIDGLLATRGVPISSSIAIACTTSPLCHGGINQTIVFTLPSSLSPNCPIGSMCPLFIKELTPGVHTVSVQNENGTSNSLNFTVTSNSTAQQLSINGLDTPASLSLGQQGTWTVRVTTNIGNTNLHYSVVWGDEANALSAAIMTPQQSSLQSSASFTHSYSRSGTYSPTFTVTDDFGHSVSTTNTIVVTPLY